MNRPELRKFEIDTGPNAFDLSSTMRRALLAVPLILALSLTCFGQASGSPQTAAASTKIEDGISRVLSDFEAAWNVHDPKAFSMAFAEDADFTNVRGKGVTGRAAVEKFHTEPFATYFSHSRLKINETKIRFIKPDVAAVDARWEMTGAVGPDGKEIPLRLGLLNFVMTEANGAWFITVMHNMDLPVPQ